MTAYTKQKEIIYISGPMEGVENYEENSICMLKGWQQSCGANREYGFALAKGMGVMFEVEE